MGDTISVSLMIMAVTVLVSLAAWQKADWMELMTMNPYLIDRKKQYWRFISSGFIHADFTHLFFNLFSRLALDFRTFLENMKMSSSLSKILQTEMNVFKSNSQIMKNKNYYKN